MFNFKKNGLCIRVQYLLYQSTDDMIKTWTLHFPAINHLKWKKHRSIVQVVTPSCGKLMLRKFHYLGMRSTFAKSIKSRARLCLFYDLFKYAIFLLVALILL